MIKQATSGCHAPCDEPGCENKTLCGPNIPEGLKLLEKFGWKIVHDADGPDALTFCPEHAKHNIFTHSKVSVDVVKDVIEHMKSAEGQAETQGRKKTETQPFRGNCANCGAVVRAIRQELAVEYDQRESGEFGRADCPQCKHAMIFYPEVRG